MLYAMMIGITLAVILMLVLTVLLLQLPMRVADSVAPSFNRLAESLDKLADAHDKRGRYTKVCDSDNLHHYRVHPVHKYKTIGD
jgi:uncharacterized protein YacL